MPKSKTTRSRVSKSEPFETMTDDKVADIQTDSVSAGEEDSSTESNHAVYKRQQAEWRKMKHQVAQLKKQRKALNKKQREKKKEISKDIRTLLSTLRLKHEEELKSLGIIPDKNRMDLDMDDDEDLE